MCECARVCGCAPVSARGCVGARVDVWLRACPSGCMGARECARVGVWVRAWVCGFRAWVCGCARGCVGARVGKWVRPWVGGCARGCVDTR